MNYTHINGKRVRILEQNKTNPEYKTNKQQVFIIGSKGIPANYGGFETFVEKLTEYQENDQIRYHVACMAKDNIRFEHNGAKCFNINVPDMGAAKAVYYDLAALKYCIDYCKERPAIQKPIFYVLACRIGPFIGYFKHEIQKLGGLLYVNPDGHEWKRAKWNAAIRKYWKLSESMMVKHADLLICDSKNIEKYIQEDYKKYKPNTTFIAYGADTTPSILSDDDPKFTQWLETHDLERKQFYLVVGRFVPENNYEIMIREFMKSNSKKSFALITNVSDKFLEELKKRTGFSNDARIKFVGTVYDQELLKKIREQAYGYFHGHEVGGTNPSLLEALGSTNLNLLLDVSFNNEVASNSAVYWEKRENELKNTIEQVESLSSETYESLGINAKNRVKNNYSWDSIVMDYERLYTQE